MNKRGFEHSYLIRLFFIAVIIGLTLIVIVRIQDDTLFIELKTLKDTTFIHDSALASPNPLHVQYKTPKNYELTVGEKSLKITSLEDPSLTPLELPIAQSSVELETYTKKQDEIQTLHIQKG